MVEQKILGWGIVGVSLILLLLLVQVKISFDEQAVYLCDVVSEDPNTSMTQCPAHNSSVPWMIMLGFALAALLLASGIYLSVPKRKEMKEKKRDIDMSNLTEEEKNIMNLLQEKGSMYQSDILKATELSKVKLTRILDRLEHQHELIERKRRGMTNLVVVK